MNNYAYLVKAKAKAADAKHLFCWLSAKSDSRADREIANILEDADIETGRGADYLQPVRTNWHVVDDLPEEGVLDSTWCDRYELGDDGLTWQMKPAEEPETSTSTSTTVDVDNKMEHPIAQLSFRQRVLAVYISEEFKHHITADQRILIADLMMDTENHYVQDLMLATEHYPEFKAYSCHDLWKLTDALKKVLAPTARHELNALLRFCRAWIDTHHIDRGLLVNEWLAGKRVAVIQHAASSETVGSGKPDNLDSQDIPQFYKRAVAQSDANLSIEIAVALLYPKAEPGHISREQLVDAKGYQDRKDPVHVKAMAVLRKLPDILEYNAWSIYSVTHALRWHGEESAVDLRGQARQWLTDNGTYENGQPSKGYPEWDEDPRATRHSSKANHTDAGEPAADDAPPQVEPLEVARLSKTVFSIDGLMGETSTSTTQQNDEGADNVSMEEAGDNEIKNALEVQPGQATNASTESGTAVSPQATALDDNFDTGHHISGVEVDSLMTHLMVDLETMGSNPEAPIVAIGAVYFDPNTGITGAEFYQIVSLESAMEFGAKPDGATIIWWLKQSSEARAAITGGEAIGLMDAVDKFDEFVHSNSANGIKSVQLWGNGSSFDNVILRRAYEQVGAELSVPFWNDRDVRTIVELGKTIGMNPRYEIPFDGEMHNALADARHQVKYVSAIWQRLVSN
jgi:exodeoxyribonuclease VIII